MGLTLIFIFTFQSTKKKTICLLKRSLTFFELYTPKILATYIFVCVFVGFKQYV